MFSSFWCMNLISGNFGITWGVLNPPITIKFKILVNLPLKYNFYNLYFLTIFLYYFQFFVISNFDKKMLFIPICIPYCTLLDEWFFTLVHAMLFSCNTIECVRVSIWCTWPCTKCVWSCTIMPWCTMSAFYDELSLSPSHILK